MGNDHKFSLVAPRFGPINSRFLNFLSSLRTTTSPAGNRVPVVDLRIYCCCAVVVDVSVASVFEVVAVAATIEVVAAVVVA